ncbi:MAG: beta strand repeat-containing protein [Caulobacteraceae bacterium]
MTKNIHWTNAVSADFSTAADWTGGVVPGSADDAYLDAKGKGAYTVTSSASRTVNGIDTASNATLAVAAFTTFTATNGTDGGVNAGTVSVVNGGAFVFGGMMNNTGSIAIGGAGNDTALEVGAGAVTLAGGGTVALSDNSRNLIIAAAFGTNTLTNVDNTISGAGYIGRSGGNQLIVTNQAKGTINANGANSLTLDASSGPFANAGLIESTGAGGLLLQAGTFANTGQIKDAGTGALTLSNATVDDSGGGTLNQGASLILNNGTILGGSLTVAAGQTVTVNAFTTGNLATTFSNAGAITVQNGAALIVRGSVANSGSIAIGGAGNDTALEVGAGAVTLAGGGTVALSDNSRNLIIAAAFGANTLTNVDNTISGAGYIGRSGGNQLIVTNQAKGTINANGANSLTLDLSSGPGVTNAGLIEATGTGGLVIQNGALNGVGGELFACAGSNLAVRNSTVNGGRLGTGAGGTITIENASSVTVDGTFANAGAIALASTGSRTSLVLDKNTTLTGGGAVSLTAFAKNSLRGTRPGIVLTNVDNTIVGSGHLGGAKLVLVNQGAGVIDADSRTPLIVDTGTQTVANAGLIETTAFGRCDIRGAVNNTGSIETHTGTLTVVGAVTGGGTATIDGGILDFDSSFTENVAFTSKNGTLGLAQSQGYAGSVSGFSKTGHSTFDLGDIAFVSAGEATFSGTTTGGVLTVTDGTHTAHITLIGNYTGSTFVASSDGNGGTLVVDPHAAKATVSPPHAFVAAMASVRTSPAAVVHCAPPERAFVPHLLAVGRSALA